MITVKHRACRISPLLESSLRAEVSSAKYDESLCGISGQLLLVSNRNTHYDFNSGRGVFDCVCEHLHGDRANGCLAFRIVLICFG